jgi:hypothetical protein
MRCNALILIAIAAFVGFSPRAMAGGGILGTAGNYAVLGASTVTNTGLTVIDGGDVGVSPGTSITGFASVDGGPGLIVPPYGIDNADAAQAQTDALTAYNTLAGLAPTQPALGMQLGGLTLTPGVYSFSTTAVLLTSGVLTLNYEGNPNSLFVFQIGSTITTATNIVAENVGNSPNPMVGCNVFWQVGSSATLGTNTAFEGHILADVSITMNSGATILDGSALALTGAVTLDDNTITNCIAPASVPEPGTMTLALIGGVLLGVPAAVGKRRRASRLRD